MFKSVLTIAIVLLSVMVASPVAFAISGACSYHGGVNCAAGASLTGDAVCNDGWISSVLYSETDECSIQVACTSPAFVTETLTDYTAASQSMRSSIKNVIASDLMNFNNQASTIQQTETKNQTTITGEIQNTNSQFDSLEQQEETQGNCGSDSPDYSQSNNTYGGLQASLQAECQSIVQEYETERQNEIAQLNATLAQEQASEQAYLVPVNQCVTNFNTIQNSFSTIDQQALEQQAIVSTTPAVSPVAQPTPPPTTPTPISSESFSLNANVAYGQSGQNVITLQNFLESKGFLTLPLGTAEGYFGNLTKQALIAFQKSAGLPATGYCGPLTRQEINNG